MDKDWWHFYESILNFYCYLCCAFRKSRSIWACSCCD